MIVADEEYLTPEDIAKQLHIIPETVLQWLRQGTLPGYKIGRLWRIEMRDYQKFLRDRYNVPEREEKGE